MGSTELQVFIALGVVLAAVLIAFAVDLLKGNIERLRERNAALKERSRAAEERADQVERLHRQLVELVEALKDAEQLRPVEVAEPMVRRPVARVPDPEPQREEAGFLLLPDSNLTVQTPTPLPESPIPVRVVSDEEDFAPGDAIIEDLPPLAELGSGAALLAEPCGRRTRRFVTPVSPAPAVAAEPVAPAARLTVETPGWEEWVEPRQEQTIAEAAPAEPAPAGAEPNPAEAAVEQEVRPVAPAGEEASGAPPVAEEGEVEAPEAEAGDVRAIEPKVVEMRLPAAMPDREERQLEVPGGVHSREVLSELMRQDLTFLGVTLSISVVDYVRLAAEHGKDAVEQVMGALEGLVQSSGNPADLICRISEDEFIVVCPGATGAAATSRVQQLSENLWDFQLRSLVSFPILFSWGASECGLMPGMPSVLADSVDRAREQMLETRRSRRALTWASAKYGLQSSAG